MFLIRPLIALTILAICIGPAITSFSAYADDGGDASAPAADAGAPSCDAEAPAADVGATVVDAPVADAPAVDTAAPEANVAAPDADTSATAEDVSAQASDIEATAADTTAPEGDAAASVDDAEATAVDDSTPIADAPVVDSTAAVSTGQSDYMPGSTVDIAGEGFAPNAEVTVTLTKPDGSETEWTVSADDAGQIATNYELTDGIEGAYFVSLSDGNNTGATLFTDPVTVLLPNGNGAVRQLSGYPSGNNNNYQKVDDAPPEPVPDGDSTYVYTNYTSTSRRDLYAIGNLPTDTVKPDDPLDLHSTSHATYIWSSNPTVVMVWSGVSDPGSATANNVTVKAYCKTTAATPGGTASVGIRPSGGTESWSTAGMLGTSYGQFSSTYTTNPATGQPWTYADINNLQAGVSLKSPSSSTQARSTMVWLEVDSNDTMASGVRDYRYAWDRTPNITMPNQGTEVPHTVTQALASGKHTFYVYARDNASNSSNTISSGQYWIDVTNPTLNTSRTPAANGNGWNRTDVTASYTASDAHSGLLSPSSGSVTVATEGAGQSVTFTVVDNVGNTNSKSVTNINIDKTKPIISGSTSPGATPYGWNNTDVTVHFDAADVLSGVATVTPDIIISSQGAGQSRTGTATDKAGNSASTTVININIDKTDPTISGSRTPGANAHDWNNNDVTVSFTASDALSGVASVTPNTTLSSDGAGQFVIGTATDKAGNSALATVGGINIDKTDPTIDGSVSPGATPYGWHNTDVTVHFDADDNLSGVDTVSPDVILSAEGAGQSAGGTATDMAGNSASATVSDINIDKTAPIINGSRTPGANANGWNNNDVTVGFTANDILSGVASVTPDATLSLDGADQFVTGTATDEAGNSASATVSGINIDKTDPTLAEDLSRTGMDEITVTLTGNDALSGVDSMRYSTDGGATWTTVYSPTATFTISGAGDYSLSNMVFDIAGNEYMLDRLVSIEGPVAGGMTAGPGVVIDVMGTVVAYPITPDGELLADVKMASPDNALVLEIPSGNQILNGDGTPANQIQIVAAETATAPAGYQMIAAYQFLPAGVTFSEDATLTLNYAPETLPQDSTAVMAFYDEAAGKWVETEAAGYAAGIELPPNAVTSHVGGANSFAIFAKLPVSK